MQAPKKADSTCPKNISTDNNNNKMWSSNKHKIELKLQAAMEGTSHPAPPTGGFRKTGNGEQYAFKKVNIEERVIVLYTCQTCCQLVALCP